MALRRTKTPAPTAHQAPKPARKPLAAQGPAPPARPRPVGSAPSLERAERLGHHISRVPVLENHRHLPATPLPDLPRTVQRFRDAETKEEVEIDVEGIRYFGEAEDYLQQIQEKKLLATTSEFLALARKRKQLRKNTGEQVIRSNLELVELVNSEESALGYYHNVDEEILTELIDTGQAPELGYANPDYFDRLSKFTWRVKPNVSAAKAIREFIDPQEAATTIVECQATIQAIYYHTLLRAVGSKRFDAVFGSEKGGQKDEDRLLIEMDFKGSNPLGKYLEDFQPTLDEEESSELTGVGEEVASAPGFRPAKLGGWYYIANHRLYTKRHSEGIWGGENALYVGRDEETGQQLWSGLGLNRVTEEQMAAHCAEEFNSPPTAKETEAICKGPTQLLSLALPVLGDLRSVRELPTLTAGSFRSLENHWRHANLESETVVKVSNQIGARGILYDLLKKQPLEPPAKAEDLLETFRLSDLDEPSGEGGAQLGDWAKGDGEVTLTWTSAAVKKTSLYNLVSNYCKAYNLSLVPQLIGLFKERNPLYGERGSKSMFPVASGAVFHFPPPSALAKLYKTPGGFQALGSKRLSIPKIEELRDRG